MIVDVHTHCLQPDHVSAVAQAANERAGYAPLRPLTAAEYDEEMEVVDKAIVFGVRGVATGMISPNEFTAEWVRRKPDKLIGFMALDPTEDDCIEQLEIGVELGLKGIKIYPMLGRYDPTDPKHLWIFEKAQRLGLPVLSHTGTHPDPKAVLKYSHPLLFDEIAQAFPDLKIVMAHMSHPWQRECAIVLRKHPNVYSDVSGVWVRPWQGWDALIGMVEWGVTDKLLFGSDFPLWTPRGGMEKIRHLNEQLEGTSLPQIPPDVIEGIIHRDSLELLGLN